MTALFASLLQQQRHQQRLVVPRCTLSILKLVPLLLMLKNGTGSGTECPNLKQITAVLMLFIAENSSTHTIHLQYPKARIRQSFQLQTHNLVERLN